MVRLLPYAPALFVLLWSTGFIGARLGMPHAEPISFLLVRYGIAVAILVLLGTLARVPWPRGNQIWHSMIVGILIHGLYLGGVFWAIDHGMPAGISAMIVGLQPLFTAALAGILLKEHVGKQLWFGLVLGFVGLVFVLWPKLNVSGSGINFATVSAALLAMAGITIGTLYQKRFIRNDDANYDMRSANCVQYIGAAIPSLIYVLCFEQFQITWNGESIFAMAWLVIILSIVAIFILMMLIEQGEISKLSSLFFLVPASTTIIAWGLFGETLSLWQLVGMGICGIAVFIARSSK